MRNGVIQCKPVDVGSELKLLVKIAVGGGALPDNKIQHPVQISKCRKRPKTVPSSGKSCFVGGKVLRDGSLWSWQQLTPANLSFQTQTQSSGCVFWPCPAGTMVPWYHGLRWHFIPTYVSFKKTGLKLSRIFYSEATPLSHCVISHFNEMIEKPESQ